MRLLFAVLAVLCTSLLLAQAAAATPAARTEPEYLAYGAVFPDPLAVCQKNCDPNSRGRTNATQFIQWEELNDSLEFMNQNADWRRYMEVWPLDGKKGKGGGSQVGDAMWPGNNLAKLEWDPKPEYVSAGLPTTDQEQRPDGKVKADLLVVRVTDENVPDAGKKRYALSLSIHGIERAGAEGGIRAMEEIVTAVAEGRGDEKILPKEVRGNAVTWRQVLANTIIYFTFPNPDGWRRGSVFDTEIGPGVFFQRYNGNGVDPNRDWPDIGYSFRPYSGSSEPETRAFQAFYTEVIRNGGPFAAGDDLHGMPFADALSYTLLPHGRHSLDKDFRLREASKLINRAQYHATKWSPYIIDNDEGPAHCEGTNLGDACDSIYAQTWGSVYDTINYTTTGDLGTWFDSRIGLNADGIDNEMAFSHLDRNIAFEPHGEQLHVSGNKAIIYSHIDDLLRPPGAAYSTPGKNGFVINDRVGRQQQDNQPAAPPGTSPQTDVADELADGPTSGPPQGSEYKFTVERDADTYSGGMRVDVRATNVQGIGSGIATLTIQCKGCDDHVGTKQGEWVTVTQDYNQSTGATSYRQAGLTAAVNRPDPGEWRAIVSAPGGVPRFSIDFTSGPATSDGATAGDPPPFLAGYDVANTDFFEELRGDAKAEDDEFSGIDVRSVLTGATSLDGFDTLVLADSAMPGYGGLFKGEPPANGPATANFNFEGNKATVPGQGPTTCAQNDQTSEEFPFTVAPNERNAQVKINITWTSPTSDYDLFLYRASAGRPLLGSSTGGPPGTGEQIIYPEPGAGDYVIVVVNCNVPAGADKFTGTAVFTQKAPGVEGATGAYTVAEKDAWMGKLRDWVSAGGNLVLTDGALRGLAELTSIPAHSIGKQTVYVGQTAFQVCGKFSAKKECEENKETLGDPLARDVAQAGARFNTGMRRQMFESTPLGFAIQNKSGADASFARQYDIDQLAFEAAGGRAAGGSADGGARNAQAVPSRTTLGEIPMGQGRIRVAGALLPQPSNEYDHPLGLEPYALTYTGYIVFCNLIDCKYEAKGRPRIPNAPAPPGPVQLPFSARVQSPLLASNQTRTGRKIRLRIRKTKIRRIKHLVLQYRRTGRGTSRRFRTLRPRLKPTTRRVTFKRGRIGRTYLFRIQAVGKNGIRTDWHHSRTVYPYDDRGKGRRYSDGWTRKTNRRAWRGGWSESSRPGATLRFRTKGGGRVYLIGHTGPDGGTAIFGRGTKKKKVSFKSKRHRNRRVVAVLNRTDKRIYRLKLVVRRGKVRVDGIAVRRR